MAEDHFPSTLNTWIDRALHKGVRGRAQVNHHVMASYFEPLRIYFLGTNATWLGEPDDVIQGFFASRLERDSFFSDWRASGKPLRRWLMNAFCFYLMEQRKERRHMAAGGGDDRDEGKVTFAGDPEVTFERAVAVSFVRQAIESAQQACSAIGLDSHWRVFVRHHVDGLNYADLSNEFDVTPARAAVMARTAGRKFQSALRDVLLRDGVDEASLDDEIDAILERTS